MNLGTYSNTLPEMVTNSRQIWKPKSQALVRKIINYLDNNLENSEYKLYSQRIYTGKLPPSRFYDYVRSFTHSMPYHKRIAAKYLQLHKFEIKYVTVPITVNGNIVDNLYQLEIYITC